MSPISPTKRNVALAKAVYEKGHFRPDRHPLLEDGPKPTREVPPTAQAMIEWLKPVENDVHGTLSNILKDDVQFEGMAPLEEVLQINPQRLEFAAKYLTSNELLYLEEHIRDSFRAQCRACEKAIGTKADCHSAIARETYPNDILLEFCLGSNVKVLTYVPVEPKQMLISDWTIDVQCRVPSGIRRGEEEPVLIDDLNSDIAKATKIARAVQNRLRSDAAWYTILMDIIEKASADRADKTTGAMTSAIKTLDSHLVESRKSELPF